MALCSHAQWIDTAIEPSLVHFKDLREGDQSHHKPICPPNIFPRPGTAPCPLTIDTHIPHFRRCWPRWGIRCLTSESLGRLQELWSRFLGHGMKDSQDFGMQIWYLWPGYCSTAKLDSSSSKFAAVFHTSLVSTKFGPLHCRTGTKDSLHFMSLRHAIQRNRKGDWNQNIKTWRR